MDKNLNGNGKIKEDGLYTEEEFVRKKAIEEIIKRARVSAIDASFPERIFSLVAKRRKLSQTMDPDEARRVCSEEYNSLSRRLDLSQIQESCSVRNVLRTRRLANLLIDDRGELKLELLPLVITHLTKHLYSIGPNRQYDAKRQEHILAALQRLKDQKGLINLLQSISKPEMHRQAEQLIRDTLQLPASNVVTDAHARRAVLSAWLCLLRQNVGSCFATAPAIMIHDEQPEQFLQDMADLLATGRLKRTFGGVEYSVPLSPSWGAGDLKKSFLASISCDSGPEIWLSPGLQAAFEVAGLIDSELTLKERLEHVRLIVEEVLQEKTVRHNVVMTTAEEIIRAALLRHLEITEKDLVDYENRPRPLLAESLMITTPLTQPKGSKLQSCLHFYALNEQAQNAFKSLADNALLKAWEFTLASFAETKAGFSRWNMYASLGLRSDEPGGIGSVLYENLKHKLDVYNQKVQEYQGEYEQLYSQVKYLEGRMRNASTEKEVQWLKADYQSKANEFYLFQELRDKLQNKAKRLSQLYEILIDFYDELFPKYFQEIYDADMHDVSVGPYDDSPAGFRLLYKHGRASTALWTRIYTPTEYVDALVNFFTSTENEIRYSPAIEGLEEDFVEISSSLIAHVKSTEFLETSFTRIAMAHNMRPIDNPLANLDRIEAKPWAYISGGTMENLTSCYYKREQKPTITSRWVESTIELLVFLVDTVKQIPYKLTQEYARLKTKSMLMHSPTHAFLFKPGLPAFAKEWETDSYTYTWVRDQIVIRGERFIQNIKLDQEMMRYLIENLSLIVPDNFRHYFKKVFTYLYGTMNPIDFHSYIIQQIEHERGLFYGGRPVLPSEEIAAYFYSHLPLFSKMELRDKIVAVFRELPGISDEMHNLIHPAIDNILETLAIERILNAKNLQDLCKVVLILITGKTSFPYDYHRHIIATARRLGYAMPEPLIFADTNWVKDEFAFVVNPATGRFELWRTDYIGSQGYPIPAWEQWLNGSRQDRSWGVYIRPYEYGQ